MQQNADKAYKIKGFFNTSSLESKNLFNPKILTPSRDGPWTRNLLILYFPLDLQKAHNWLEGLQGGGNVGWVSLQIKHPLKEWFTKKRTFCQYLVTLKYVFSLLWNTKSEFVKNILATLSKIIKVNKDWGQNGLNLLCQLCLVQIKKYILILFFALPFSYLMKRKSWISAKACYSPTHGV